MTGRTLALLWIVVPAAWITGAYVALESGAIGVHGYGMLALLLSGPALAVGLVAFTTRWSARRRSAGGRPAA